jgi:pimeloyl-ACP methyl ester carboxylesterase
VQNLERFFLAFDNTQTTTIESQLRALTTPTLIVWGAEDAMFDPRWADWLAETISGARPPIKIDDAKMFHPEEFPDQLSDALRHHWSQPQ